MPSYQNMWQLAMVKLNHPIPTHLHGSFEKLIFAKKIKKFLSFMESKGL
jgi:hypothetical protein